MTEESRQPHRPNGTDTIATGTEADALEVIRACILDFLEQRHVAQVLGISRDRALREVLREDRDAVFAPLAEEFLALAACDRILNPSIESTGGTSLTHVDARTGDIIHVNMGGVVKISLTRDPNHQGPYSLGERARIAPRRRE